MKSPAAIVACLSSVLVFATACSGPASPRPNAAALDPGDPTVVWDYRDVSQQPELLNRSESARAIGQNYPPSLRAQGITGSVTLELVTSAAGTVESVRVVNATDPQFGDAAREVAVRMRFKPATVRGILVRCRFTLPISFDLQR